MSWLRDFLNSRKECPICKGQLQLGFTCAKRRDVVETKDKLSIKFDLNTFSPSIYKGFAELIIDIETLSFDVIFYDHLYIERKSNIPFTSITSFQNLMLKKSGNASNFEYRCLSCKDFIGCSNYIFINWKDSSFICDTSSVFYERYSLSRMNLLYELYNFPNKEYSMLYYGKFTDEHKNLSPSRLKELIEKLDVNVFNGYMKLPYQTFKEKESILDKLEILIVFS